MTYLKFTVRNLTWAISISLMCALALTMAACGDSETEGDATLPPATVPPTVAVAATQPPTEVPTATPEPPPGPTKAPTNTPAPTQVPEPTPAPTTEPTATPEPLPETYPLEIRDMMGRPVTIPAEPTRIVSISPTATEMLYTAGGTAIARDNQFHLPTRGPRPSGTGRSLLAQL